MRGKAEHMSSWLKNITFNNGEIPCVNDAAVGIAPKSESLIKYAENLSIYSKNLSFSDSGYRMIKKNNYELFIDIGPVGADYQPGHAHADTFNFLLNVKDEPIFVDTGTSTYEIGTTREKERATDSHNTVSVNKKNSSEVWGGFRVGNRAKIVELNESNNQLLACHDGYKGLGVIHCRNWRWSEKKIVILDKVKCKRKVTSKAYFHLYPKVQFEKLHQYLIQ